MIAVVDEIYEHIWSDGHPHVSLASLPGMRERNGDGLGARQDLRGDGMASGLGGRAAPALGAHPQGARLPDDLRSAPFQEAGCTALALPDRYYENLRAVYAKRRTILLEALTRSGLAFTPPEGAYYVMVDARALGWQDDCAFVDFLDPQGRCRRGARFFVLRAGRR